MKQVQLEKSLWSHVLLAGILTVIIGLLIWCSAFAALEPAPELEPLAIDTITQSILPPVAPRPNDIGTAHPITGLISADDGSWFVLCSARKDTDGDGKIEVTLSHRHNDGDTELPYLVLGRGPGVEIEYPAARSKHGEWLAVVRSGTLELIEAATFKRWTLSADVTNDHHDLWPERNARFVSIAANGTRMTYLKKHREGDAIVIRELPSGTERTVVIKDKLWRATVDSAGRWAEVTVIRADTDKDGKIEWPGGPSSWSLSACNIDTSHRRNPRDGDTVTTLWLDLVTGTLVEDPLVIGVVGDELLRRPATEPLVLGTTTLDDRDCHAEVVGVIASPPRVLITCGLAPGFEMPVWVLGVGIAKQKTRWKEYRSGRDSVHAHDRFERVDDNTFVDLVDGSEITLPGASGWLTHRQGFVLVNVKGGWATFDLSNRKTTLINEGGDPGYVWQFGGGGTIVPVGSSAYDLRTGKRVGSATDDSIVLSDNRGRVLRRLSPSRPTGKAASGPLRWDP